MPTPGPHELPFPISDEGFETWMVQYQYATKVTVPINHSALGAILARVKVAEAEREKIRVILQRVLSVSADHRSVRELLHDELRSLAEDATGEKNHIRL